MRYSTPHHNIHQNVVVVVVVRREGEGGGGRNGHPEQEKPIQVLGGNG